jgi:pimeloyl-ACP methyl ester carboxylesterase
MPEARAFFDSVFPGRLHVYYDKRGLCLSDRNPPDFSLDALVSDLEAVTNSLGLSDLVLWGPGDGGAVAIAYAARHPERVSHLVLYGAYCSLQGLAPLLDALVSLAALEWDLAAQAIAQLASPGTDPAATNAIATVIKSSTTPGNASRMLRHAIAFDVTTFLAQIQTPTLIMHRRGDRVVPFDAGRELAILIPTARFVPLDGDCHTFVLGDIAPIADAVTTFLQAEEARPYQSALPTTGLRTHDALVREALRAHGGQELKTMGDGFMAAFSSATRATECAIAMQRAFAAHNESAETPVRVRMGLNVGEPIAEEEDLFGTAVILAARIAAMAAGGEILASDVVRQLTAGKGFLFADRGASALRGFEDPVRLYEVRWSE